MDTSNVSLIFKSFSRDVERYQSITKWIISEQEQALREPNSKHGREFVQYMDEMDHVMTLLTCLAEVCKIIREGESLLASRVDSTSTSDSRSTDFSIYINKRYRTTLMPCLTSNYTDKKPRHIVPMLYALEKLKIFVGKISDQDQTALHHALTATFGSVGVRTGLSDALNKYAPDLNRPNANREREIEKHTQLIKAFLPNGKEG